jgi:1-acyl-sn-glycerol-3-phosphate acyltransferase
MIDNTYQPETTLFRRFSMLLAGLFGWKIVVNEPIPTKCVIVGAYHTSSWDIFVTLLARAATGYPFQFIFKSSITGIPGWILRRLGGIPVNRHASEGFVGQMTALYAQHDTLMLAISPEGSRGKVTFWRTGFYYMALEANVPIVLCFADYKHKVVGAGRVIMPSGNIEADFDIIRDFYADVTARHPHKQGKVQLRTVEASGVEPEKELA